MKANIAVFDEASHVYDYSLGRVVTRERASWPLWYSRAVLFDGSVWYSGSDFRAPDEAAATEYARRGWPSDAVVTVHVSK